MQQIIWLIQQRPDSRNMYEGSSVPQEEGICDDHLARESCPYPTHRNLASCPLSLAPGNYTALVMLKQCTRHPSKTRGLTHTPHGRQ